jgi:hypothetical protein
LASEIVSPWLSTRWETQNSGDLKRARLFSLETDS